MKMRVCFFCFLIFGMLVCVGSKDVLFSLPTNTLQAREQLDLLYSGDENLLAYINFQDYEGLVSFLLGNQNALSYYDADFSDYDRQFLLCKGLLGGFRNLDPRIRMASSVAVLEKLSALKRKAENVYIKLLFALQPQVHEVFLFETALSQYYSSQSFYGRRLVGTPYQFIRSLDLHLTRDFVVAKLNKDLLLPSSFESIDAWLYLAITSVIDREDESEVPIYSLKDRFEILASSLKNPSDHVQKSAAQFLARMYHVDDALKEPIRTLAQESHVLQEYLQ